METKTSMSKVTIHRGSELHWVGDGFPVRSIFSYNDLGQKLSPFLLLDYAPPYRFEPGAKRKGVGEHPHRGFETVTIAYQGEIGHRDSSGGGGMIGPGDVQWMTAGSGLVHEELHSEEFTRSGGLFEMVQLWVNLPAKHKDAKPKYQTLLNSQIPKIVLDDGAGELRVIAGEFKGTRGPANTFTPVNLWDLTLQSQKSVELSLNDRFTNAVLVLRGAVSVDGIRAEEGDLAIVEKSLGATQLEAFSDAKLLVLGGEPLNEPIVGYGPFVMNTQQEIRRAFTDYQSGAYGRLESSP